MANLNALTKKDLIELIDKQNEELATQNQATEELKSDFQKQMEEMKTMMLGLQAQALSGKTTQQPTQQESNDIVIISNLIGKNSVNIDTGNTITFEKSGDYQVVTKTDVRAMLQFAGGKNRKLFDSGLLYFEDDEVNTTFRLRPRKPLTDENIIEAFTLKKDEFVDFLKTATDSKRDEPATHNVQYKVGILYKKGKIKNMTAEIMEAFNGFFGRSIFDLNVDFLIEDEE